MALARLSRLSLNVLKESAVKDVKFRGSALHQIRSVVYSENGGILPMPEKVAWGLPKVLLVVGASVYVGGTISKNGAAFLEEHDIFVPDEDDD